MFTVAKSVAHRLTVLPCPERSVSSAENGAEPAEKSDEWSGAVNGSQRKTRIESGKIAMS